ncbi:MAG TPA: hypothetical protein VFA18_05855 [Gemmataceae bacterium]|nr:hypothetical protein [Gemmataceae bacterium]
MSDENESPSPLTREQVRQLHESVARAAEDAARAGYLAAAAALELFADALEKADIPTVSDAERRGALAAFGAARKQARQLAGTFRARAKPI